MMPLLKLILLFVPALLATVAFSQSTDKAMELYAEGAKHFKEKDYKTADSLFTLSLEITPTGKGYFGRGAARYNLRNVRGYCGDMQEAIKYGEPKAENQYANKCVIVDTVYADPKRQKKAERRLVFEVLTRGIYNDIVNISAFDKKGVQIAQFFTLKKDTTFIEVQDEFSAKPSVGSEKLKTYFTNDLNYPSEAKSKKISGTVYVSCIIKKDGSLGKIVIERSIGFGCDEEAKRLVRDMPKWTNGSFLGKRIKTQVLFQIDFNLN